MHLLGSSWLRSKENVGAKVFCVSDQRWVIGLEDGSVNVLNNEGMLEFKNEFQEIPGRGRPLNAIAIADNRRLYTSWLGEPYMSGCSVMDGDFGQSCLLAGYDRSEPGIKPNLMVVLPSHPRFILAVESLERILVLGAATLSYSMVDFRAPIQRYECSDYHAAHSLLALVAREGVVHLLAVPAGTRRPQLQSVCTISVLASRALQGQRGTKGTQIHSVLILSPTRILTGHGDGMIRVWDIGRLPPGPADEVAHLGTWTCAVQAHHGSECAVNGLLALTSWCVGSEAASTRGIITTCMDGRVGLWRFSPASGTTHMDDMLTLVAGVNLFAGLIASSTLDPDDKWLYAAGDEDGSSRIRAWKLDGAKHENRVEEVGGPRPKIWHVHCTRKNRLLMSMRKDDAKAYGEVWDVNDME